MRLAAILALLPACSWAFVDAPPLYVSPEARSIECTKSLASPIADTVLAAVMYAGAGVLLAASRHQDNDGLPTGGQSSSRMLAIPALLIAVPHTFSAVYGYQQTARCRHVNRVAAIRKPQ
ncbi:MAG: hypothetical protein H0T46_33615 [Deltaproteobacteria bacterium]|nr:hypothetical protein [Deltaproteobacteria bacterium]